MSNFDESFNKVILFEGGYVNDPDDKGGETYLGISRKNNPKWGGWAQIDKVKKQYGTKNITSILKKDICLSNSAKLYYKLNYWDKLELDDIPNDKIAYQLFDTSVNCGITTAIRLAQQCCTMTVTGKWSAELKYNLMQYGKNK